MLVFYIKTTQCCNMEEVLDLKEGNVYETWVAVLKTLKFNCMIG